MPLFVRSKRKTTSSGKLLNVIAYYSPDATVLIVPANIGKTAKQLKCLNCVRSLLWISARECTRRRGHLPNRKPETQSDLRGTRGACKPGPLRHCLDYDTEGFWPYLKQPRVTARPNQTGDAIRD